MASAPSDALARRRAVGVLILSALLPGSVQRLRGNRAVGSVTLRVWLGIVAVVVVTAIAAWLAPGPVVGLLLQPWLATSLRVLVWVLFAAWVLLLLDAWRLAHPMELPQRARLAMTIAVIALCVALGLLTNLIASALLAVGNLGTVLPGGGDAKDKQGRYNVLLLGVDSAEHRIGLRPDSINVASIDVETGRTVIFGLPRNMQRVPFPEDNPLHDEFPDGFVCPDDACMLNAVWTAAEDRADLFPEGSDPGLVTTKGVVGEVLGLELNYYALIDMHGFSSIIDAMGGIRLNVMKRIPIGGGSSPISGYIEPGRNVALDGRNALWFARSREGSSDYERMQRQKCVMTAMAKQLDPQTVASRFVELSEAGKDLLRTDVPRDQIITLADLALKVREHDIVSVNFTPPLVPHTANPDFAMIRAHVQQQIAALEAADDAPSATPSPSAPSTQASAPAPTTSPAQSEDESTSNSQEAAPSQQPSADRPEVVCSVD